MSIRVPVAEAELARAALVELAPAGFEEREESGQTELAVYVDTAGAKRFRAAFPDAVSTPVEAGWEVRWRDFHRPARVAGLWIGPPWEALPAGEPAVVIDPGRAFGTGAHPTTRACLELLAGESRGSVLDAGCGSGVLAIAAARLGFAPVTAVDSDPVAVTATRENAVRNGVRLEALQVELRTGGLPAADLVVANLDLEGVAWLLRRRPARRAITSGYLARERPAHEGWRLERELELDGWSAHVFAAL